MKDNSLSSSVRVVSTLIAISASCLAHSGSMFVAGRVEQEIRLDGDLSDWPPLEEYEVSVPYLFEGEPNSADFTGRFRVGCDFERELLYVGVEVIDDNINLESSSDAWNSCDACEVFLTLEHSANQTVPLQFVYRTIPRVCEADKLNTELQKSFTAARRRRGNKLTYEWQIDLGALPKGESVGKNPTVFGFDVGYIDVDQAGDVAVFSSSPGSVKHLTSATLGDLFIAADAPPLVETQGRVKWIGPTQGQQSEMQTGVFPPVAIRSKESTGFYLQVPCDGSGRYATKLPLGSYLATPCDTLDARISSPEAVAFNVCSGNASAQVSDLLVRQLQKPDLINETGVLLCDEFDADQVDQFVTAYMDFHSIPGLSLAIVKDGQIVYGKGFGVKSLTTREPVSDSTVFEVASMTKPMFAFAVCRLVERGIIDLDEPLWTYLPYADIEHDERYKKITARMVLCHRAGFPNWRDGQLKIHFEPGTQQMYSGEAYGYLAKVVSHLTGKGMETVMQEEVFSPLEIDNTFLTWDEDADDSLVAMPHDENNTALTKSRWSNVWVAGCLHVDARNFAKFLQAVINEKGLSTKSYAEMLRPQVIAPAGSDDQNFSLGFVVNESELGKHYHHGGHNSGFTSSFEVYKEHKFGYVFIVNNYHAPKFDEDLKAFLVTGADGGQSESRISSTE